MTRVQVVSGDLLLPRSGQKLFGITDIPNEVVVTAADEAAESVTVTYRPDGHRSTAADLAAGLPRGSWPRFRDDPGHRAGCLRAVLRDGFVVLGGVPDRDGVVAEVAGCFGYVRETNYGRLFDVRDPVPTAQLLHCRASAAEGGDTVLVDGFRAAALLREEDPGSFRVLTGTAVSFGFDDRGTALRACQPLIDLDPRGRIRGVRFNNRITQALRRPHDEVVAFYAAYRRCAELLARPELAVLERAEEAA
jgi:gamma-butyrobetaine dioxygenase